MRMRTGTSKAIAGLLLFGLAANANASPYVVSIQEVGFDVVATGTGNIDLTGLTLTRTSGFVAAISPSSNTINLNSIVGAQEFTGTMSGPPTNIGFGRGSVFADSSSGPFVSFESSVFLQGVRVFSGYVSDSPVGTSTDTFIGFNFPTLGLTPGTYEWTWGSGPDQSFTIQVGPLTRSAVPLPATLPLFATGLGALGLIGWRRKQKATLSN